jgi:glycerophosphoryl diester phosphodiesterase
MIVAHRGGAGLWPENSLLAYRNAMALGVDFLECDVHLTKDGAVAVIHDPTLERTTNGQGKVATQTLAELSRVRLRDRSGVLAEERIPLLDDLAELVRGQNVGLFVEIKSEQTYSRYPGLEEAVLRILHRDHLIPRVRIVSFDLETLHEVRSLHDTVQTGGLFSTKGLTRSGWTLSEALQCLVPLGCALVGLEFPLVDQRAVEECRRLGLGTAAWTVNDPDEMERLSRLGIDALITDRPDLAQALLKEI